MEGSLWVKQTKLFKLNDPVQSIFLKLCQYLKNFTLEELKSLYAKTDVLERVTLQKSVQCPVPGSLSS